MASEYGEELLQEELMESGNAGNPDLNHNTKESGQCADKEICFAKKSLKNVQASSVIKVLRGRMDRYQMEEFIRNQGIHLVIDATHPHARLVSEETHKRADGPVSARTVPARRGRTKEST
ncbi:MAG: precorrin-6A/cobalt-precorrin-6A reductase [Clostridium fessum]